jgi:hypothetical protein
MQPTEPGAADVDMPYAPTPMRLEETRTPMALETAPPAAPTVTGTDIPAPKPREVNKHIIRRGGAPSGEQPAGAAKVPVTEMAPEPAPETDVPIEPRTPGGKVPIAQPPAGIPQTQATATPAGTVIQAANPHDIPESWKKYQEHIAADPTREVALLYNHDLDQWAIVQGGPGDVPTLAAMQRLGWEVRDTALARHSHPVGPGGLTTEQGLLPSGRKGDIEIVRRDAPKGEPSAAAHMSAIDVMTARGRDRTFIFYDRRTDMWIVDYPAAGERGGRGRVSFKLIDLPKLVRGTLRVLAGRTREQWPTCARNRSTQNSASGTAGGQGSHKGRGHRAEDRQSRRNDRRDPRTVAGPEE